MSEHFIKTSFAETADQLRKSGLTELPKQGEFYVFLNNGKQSFSKEDDKKVILTNTMDM